MKQWRIERLGRRGDGVAACANERALAPLTLPGEIVEGQGIDGAIASPRILRPSCHRVRPLCGHYRACGGCSMMHASEDFTAAWKRQVVETALAAQDLPAPVVAVHVSPPRSRRRAVLSGRRTRKGATVGFHARASKVITDLTDCHVLHPQITSALPLLRRIVMAGASRGAELTLTAIHGPAGLDLAVRGGKPLDRTLFHALAELAAKGDLARLDWDGEAITRRPPMLVMGRAHVVPPPGAFLQATCEGEAALLAAVRDIIGDSAKLVDLFAGCGTFSLPLAETAAVHAVEGLSEPLAALQNGWQGAPGLRRVTTEIRDLARRPLLVDELSRFDAIVIDPPRAGAEAQTRQIAASAIARLAFVACDPVNFARDARILYESGMRLRRLWIIDQFRWSPHVETVAEFTRS